jgi:hypothetical protein
MTPGAAGGNIAIEMHPNCGVQEAFTVGACKVQGLPNHWSR